MWQSMTQWMGRNAFSAGRRALWAGWCLAAVLACGAAWGEDFRIDSEVFAGEEKEPIAETLTIFSDGLVYDFILNGEKEITIFDPQRGRFSIIDVQRKLRTSVRTQDLMDYVFDLNQYAAKSDDKIFAFAAAPQWTPQFEEFEENGQSFTRATLAGGPIEYRAVGKHPPKPDIAPAYRYFADWYARLNATRGNLPPAARLDVNKALGERGLIPTRIDFTATSGRFSKKLELHSQHLTNWALSGADRERIVAAGGYLTDPALRVVSFDEYRAEIRKAVAAAAAAEANKR